MDERQYREWLEARESILEGLREQLDPDARRALDLTPGSLRAQGELLVARFPSLAALHDAGSLPLHRGLATYAFEVFRRNLGLEPRLPLGDERYEHHGIPVLRFGEGPDCDPFGLVTFTVHRRAPALLREV